MVPSPIGIPAKPRIRPALKGSNDVEYSPLEPQLSSRLSDPLTPLLEAEMPLPPAAVLPGEDDDDDVDWETRPVIPLILAEDNAEADQGDGRVADVQLVETGHPSEYVNPFVDDADMNAILTNINTNVTEAPGSDSQPDNVPGISPVVAPSRQFSMTLPIIREASDIPLPSDTESENGLEPMSAGSEFACAFTYASDHSPMPSLHSLPNVEDAFDGGDDFSDYVGSSACTSATYFSWSEYR